MAIIGEKSYIAISVIINLIMMQAVSAQRPSFAGSRPPNGLSQKDKYLTTTTATSSADIQNRFGSSGTPVSIQIPFGQPQKPPVGIVVAPESTYIQLAATDNSVAFVDRFGETGTNVISSSPIVPTATPAPGHPFDAHGDQQLIEQLSKLPVDKRPFWFLNYQAIEAQRNGSATNSVGAQASRGSFFG